MIFLLMMYYKLVWLLLLLPSKVFTFKLPIVFTNGRILKNRMVRYGGSLESADGTSRSANFFANNLDHSVKSLLEKLYNQDKTRIVGELATIYKERIIEYHIFQCSHSFTFDNLILREGNPYELECLRKMENAFPHIKPSLVTKVSSFFDTHDVYIPCRSSDTNDDAMRALERARTFEFEKDDLDKELCMDLCDVIALQLRLEMLPPKDELHEKLYPSFVRSKDHMRKHDETEDSEKDDEEGEEDEKDCEEQSHYVWDEVDERTLID